MSKIEIGDTVYLKGTVVRVHPLPLFNNEREGV